MCSVHGGIEEEQEQVRGERERERERERKTKKKTYNIHSIFITLVYCNNNRN